MSEETLVSIVDEAIHHAERLEEGLTIMVGIRDRSVGIALKRANYKIAALQNSIAVAEGRAVVASATLMELAGWKAHLSLEDYLAEEFKLLNVNVRVRHILPDRYVRDIPCQSVSAVTVAYIGHLPEGKIRDILSDVELLCWRDPIRASTMIDEIYMRLNVLGFPGVAVCTTPKSKLVRRIISEGKLLKALRAEG